MTASSPLAVLLLQITTILIIAKLTAALVARAGQPAVVGEMLGGILLGPSFFGLAFPAMQQAIFPADRLGPLQLVSNIGVILFMFLVGCEFDPRHVTRRARTAVLVSQAGIALPLVLGIALAWTIHAEFAPAGVPFLPFALFVGTAMSITAFPVLARILAERELTHTVLGSTAIACAAIDDVSAWCILSIVVAVAKAHGLQGAAMTIGLTLLYAAVMVAIVRPIVRRIRVDSPRLADRGFAAVLIFAFASALATEIIGVHAIFGAFLAGVVVSANPVIPPLVIERVKPLASAVLVPLFFASAGLRTELALFGDVHGWSVCLAIIAVAVTGKFGGGILAAGWSGMAWRDAFALGTLMNTRGLMELIVLNVGYELGILSPSLFSMMVLMALVTTAMTAPLLGVVAPLSVLQAREAV
jgi:Kef-type K+ transport system membrane component KefB